MIQRSSLQTTGRPLLCHGRLSRLSTPQRSSCTRHLFSEPIIQPTAAHLWTLGVNLYEVFGERPLFETFAPDCDDIVAEMINTLGQPPVRWWNPWAKRFESFEEDGSWVTDLRRISTSVLRRLHQWLWDMGLRETKQTCEWDVEGGELRSFMLMAIMVLEPAERFTADQLLSSEYMVKWALPAWGRQEKRQSAHPIDE